MSERGDDRNDRGNKPLETLRDGALKVAIFRNRSDNGPFYSLDPGRIYTDDRTGDIKEVSSLSGSEPLRMAQLLTRGYERVAEFREQDKEDAKEQQKEDRGSKRGRTRRRDNDERDR